MEVISRHHCFDGEQGIYSHASSSTACNMRFSVFVPAVAAERPLPVVYWLSGLTCTEANFTEKAGAQRAAVELGLILVAPDTSPRGEGVPDDPEGAYGFGLGAGFYVDATQEPWRQHYRMRSYVESELPALIREAFPVDAERESILGHSMGGHGALTIALRNPGRYRAVSAFAPIASPLRCPWGERALTGYLGPDRGAWREYDACALIEEGARVDDLLIDQGTADGFVTEQLKPELLEGACRQADIPLTLRRQPGYDHSYYFIATFIEDHLRWHAERLAR